MLHPSPLNFPYDSEGFGIFLGGPTDAILSMLTAFIESKLITTDDQVLAKMYICVIHVTYQTCVQFFRP